MKVIQLDNKTFLIRHWFRWYRVQRAGKNWLPLRSVRSVPADLPSNFDSIDHAAALLSKKGSASISVPKFTE